MVIKSGEYEIIYSGSVIGIKNEPIEFQFPSKYGAIKISIRLEKASNTYDNNVHANAIDDKTLELVIKSNSGFGLGNTELMELGFADGRRLYLNYRIFSIQNLSKTFHYTFYLGKQVNYGR